ncbi:MAG: hypothetical protein DWQ29_11230, partial [Planctomycetota bacterium]
DNSAPAEAPQSTDADPQPELPKLDPADLDSPEGRIAEITRLRTLPDAVIEVRFEDGQKKPANERPPTEEEIAQEQVRRNTRIIELASGVIEQVHAEQEKEQLFNNAVYYLGDARVNLALSGDAEQAQLLSDDADALYERDPTSFSAVEAGAAVVELASQMASRYGSQNPEWVKAYSVQARLFAERFPQEQGRVAVNLISAGRKCEQFALREEARRCFLLVEQLYPGTPFTEQISGVLRRLRIEGQPLELSGTTIDGGFFTPADFAGKPMLVVFWASTSETFRRDLPQLQQLTDTYGSDQLTVVGVNLDTDEFHVDAFLEETGIGWRQIFFSEMDKRGGRNPVARYYGVRAIPEYWLVDAGGIVTKAPANPDQLPNLLAQLLTGQ